jgi:hypothetical protein
MDRRSYAVWSLPPTENPKFLGDANSIRDAFKFKIGMEMIGHTHVKVIDIYTGQEVKPNADVG